MTKEQLAQRLTGREIGEEVTTDEAVAAAQHGLVIVFGASDDLMEFRGAIADERDAYEGGVVWIDREGLLPERMGLEDDAELERYLDRKRGRLHRLEALWCKEGEWSWTFHTQIPHATFEIFESGTPYCLGMVFNLNEL